MRLKAEAFHHRHQFTWSDATVCVLVHHRKRHSKLCTHQHTSTYTQPPTLCGTRDEYRPKCSDALWLESKGRMAHSICDPSFTRAIRYDRLTCAQKLTRCPIDFFAVYTTAVTSNAFQWARQPKHITPSCVGSPI